MADYRLGREAENDLLAIGRHTARIWGIEQADRYLSTLEEHFAAIGRGTARTRQVLEHRTDLFVCRCRHHFVFFARDDDLRALILAILHESMDLMSRLRERLEP